MQASATNANLTSSDVYGLKQAAWQKWVKVTAQRILAVDPRLTMGNGYVDMCCLHNWGSPEAKAVEARQDRVWKRYSDLSERAYCQAEHRQHIARGEAGRYLWCSLCTDAR